MTENKRYKMETIDGTGLFPFIVDNTTAKKNGKFTSYHTYETHRKDKCQELVDLLNEKEKTIQNKQNHIVVLENKIVRMRKAIHKLEWLSSHRNADLIRENGQLNRENKHIKTTVKQLYESERTELGKSVLKQVMEAIE